MARLRAMGGILGPAAFTAAWWISGHRQRGYAIAHEHISGLAARDAEDPAIMTAGFLALGGGTLAFASELDRRLRAGRDPGWGPALVGAAGVWTALAGVFRRDRRANHPGGDPSTPSWTNDLHDVASVSGAAMGLAGLAALARRFSSDPSWTDLAQPAAWAAAAGAASTAWFLHDPVRPGNGIVQRLSVSVPLGVMGVVAARMLRAQAIAEDGTSARARSTSSAIAPTSSSTEA